MCNSKLPYQYLNPTTQVALFSVCPDHCPSVSKIIWNIYTGSKSNSNIVQWKQFYPMEAYQNKWFFGKNNYYFSLYES